jgi:TRAP-type C4-dicarboxylate transport system substrate-binding protein
MRHALLTLCLAATVFLASGTARAENVLKFGSLAPAQSPWAQVLTVWQRAVKERTNGALALRVRV